MPAFETLLARLAKTKTEAEAAEIREAMLKADPGAPGAAEAAYRLGLYHLYRGRDLDLAKAAFQTAARAKQPPFSIMARSSLGLLLLRAGETQKALFTLRRAAGSTPPSLQSAEAQGFLIEALIQAGQGRDAERAKRQLEKQLQALAQGQSDAQVRDPAESALAALMLGLHLKREGQRAEAKAWLQKAQEGPLDASLKARAKAALAEL